MATQCLIETQVKRFRVKRLFEFLGPSFWWNYLAPQFIEVTVRHYQRAVDVSECIAIRNAKLP
jgi:hypothetical protein